MNFCTGLLQAAAPDPARDYWCANHRIATHAIQPRLNQPRLLKTWKKACCLLSGTFMTFSMLLGVLLVMKTLDE